MRLHFIRLPSGWKTYICSPVCPMRQFQRHFFTSLRFVLLTLSVLLVLGLNQRTVSVLRLPDGKGPTRFTAPPKATVVKQKVLLEATTSLAHFVAPAADMWLPTSPTVCWRPTMRRALAVPCLCVGVRAAEVFRTRLLAVVLSPQAP